jgi:hypothetical protein
MYIRNRYRRSRGGRHGALIGRRWNAVQLNGIKQASSPWRADETLAAPEGRPKRTLIARNHHRSLVPCHYLIRSGMASTMTAST